MIIDLSYTEHWSEEYHSNLITWLHGNGLNPYMMLGTDVAYDSEWETLFWDQVLPEDRVSGGRPSAGRSWPQLAGVQAWEWPPDQIPDPVPVERRSKEVTPLPDGLWPA